jgi:putative membrane protein
MNAAGLTYFSGSFTSARKTRIFQTLLALYSVLTLCGYVFVAADLLPDRFSWVASLIMMLAAAVVFLSESRTQSPARNAVLFAAIVCCAFGLEYVGMRFGVPFGAYEYTHRLGISFLDVPLAIPAAWYTTVITTWRIAQRAARTPLNIAITAGVLTLALDLVLEPMASVVNRYWIWSGDAVPIQNYLAWFVVGSLAVYALERAEPSVPHVHGVYQVSMMVFMLQAGLFIVTDLAAGFVAEVLLAATVVVGYFFLNRRWTVQHAEAMR